MSRRYFHYREAELDWGAFYFIATISSWVGIIVLALSVASALFYLTELAEEYSVVTKRILRALVFSVAALHGLVLVVDEMSWWRSVLSMAALLGPYRLLLRRFPWVSLSSTVVLAAVAMFVVDNASWYSYFLTTDVELPFWSVVPFFLTMVWLVPIGFFVSLAIEDERMPGGGGGLAGGGDDGRRSSVWRSIMALVSGGKKSGGS